MPKAKLEFNLPEENHEFKTAINAEKYIVILVDIYNYLRNKVKYEDLQEIEVKVYRDTLNWFIAGLNEAGVDLFDE